mgnify:CR=1 FL=1
MAKRKRVLPSKARRQIGAYLIDTIILLLFFLAGYYSTLNLFHDAFHVKEKNQERIDFALDSTLVFQDKEKGILSYQKDYLKEEDKDINGNTVLGYKALEQKVFYYYTDFLIKDDRIDNKANTKEEAIRLRNKNIYGLQKEKNHNNYYELEKDSNGIEIETSYPILKKEVQEQLSIGSKDRIHQLYRYYVSKEGDSGVYDIAYRNLYSQPYRQERRLEIDKATYYSRLPYGLVFPVLFFFIVPLCNKEGKTLGKMILHLSVLDVRTGDAPKKWQVGIHYLFILSYWIRIFAVPLWYFKIIGPLLMAVDYLIRITSRRVQSLHDTVSRTYVAYLTKERKVLIEHPRSPEAEKEIQNVIWVDE